MLQNKVYVLQKYSFRQESLGGNMSKKTTQHLEWEDSMSVGVAYLDEDHRKLFSLIKKLAQSDPEMNAHGILPPNSL